MEQTFMVLPISVFLSISNDMLRCAPGLNAVVHHQIFRALFGTTPTICALIWKMIGTNLPRRCSPKHLLWSMMFLKVYASEHNNRIIAGTDEKTFRKWSWIFISWFNGLKSASISNCLISVDGTDFQIYEPTPFSGKWYSHKFHGPGVRYDVGISIREGNIVWVHGPFPCGAFPDLTMFRLGMKRCLQSDEIVVADGGYQDKKCRKSRETANAHTTEESVVRARHETVNR